MYIKDIAFLYMISNRHVMLYYVHVVPTYCLFTDNTMNIGGDRFFFGGGGVGPTG